jgi:VWFA-related protein
MAIALSCGAWAGFIPAVHPGQSIKPQASNPSQQPGIVRVFVRLIPVDVRVTDRADRPVTDLKQEDFQVFENGQPQDIRHFSVQTLTATSGGPPSAALRIPTTIEPTARTGRTFLIMMGRGRHQQALKAVDALIRFVREDLLPQDLVAVYAYNRATDFTSDREQIVHVLEQYKKTSDKIESWLEQNLRGFRIVYGARQVPKSLQLEIERIFESATGLASRQVLPGRVDAGDAVTGDWEETADFILGKRNSIAEARLHLT